MAMDIDLPQTMSVCVPLAEIKRQTQGSLIWKDSDRGKGPSAVEWNVSMFCTLVLASFAFAQGSSQDLQQQGNFTIVLTWTSESGVSKKSWVAEGLPWEGQEDKDF